MWSEKADGLGLRPRIVKIQSQNRPKRNVILDLKRQLMVRPVVAGIQNHDLEPEPNIKRLSACMDFGSWSRTVARVWPNCCQLTLWLSLSSGERLWSSCSNAVCQSKKFCWPQDQSVDDELNRLNLIVNGLILTNGQKIARI